MSTRVLIRGVPPAQLGLWRRAGRSQVVCRAALRGPRAAIGPTRRRARAKLIGKHAAAEDIGTEPRQATVKWPGSGGVRTAAGVGSEGASGAHAAGPRAAGGRAQINAPAALRGPPLLSCQGCLRH
ncbi:unnamed protein product, partial [Iphiclides podalirius]